MIDAMKKSFVILIILFAQLCFAEEGFLPTAPKGYDIEVYVGNLPSARMMRFDSQGRLLVSSHATGNVFSVENQKPRLLLTGLNRPHGIEFIDDYVYIGEVTQIGRAKYDTKTGLLSSEYQPIIEDLPDQGAHATRTLHFKDGWLYVPIGSSCNSCIEKNPRNATIERHRPDGSAYEVVATGVRNSVDFAWAPFNGKLYATVNGRDLLGDHFPPDTLIEVEQGGFYGWPYANGFLVPDPVLGKLSDAKAKIAKAKMPVHGFDAHNAPLGMAFIDDKTALVALHGSWNSTKKVGYKVVKLTWQEDGSIFEEDFITGFLKGEEVLGRPVGVAVGPDNAIYISDDFNGQIYRVSKRP